MSLCLDFDETELDMMTFNGRWSAERRPERFPLHCGVQSVGSRKGIPGHAHSPCVILCRPDAGEDWGKCWGFSLVYSGNFLIQAEKNEAGVRLNMGIHPEHFCWTLEPGDFFAAPETAMTFSGKGFQGMSRNFHRAVRKYLLPERWNDMEKSRPVLLNSWEACFFDYDETRLLVLADKAKRAGADLFVLDDGWFKGRN